MQSRVRDDNRPVNLELWTRSQPAGQRVDDKIAWALEFLASYGYEMSKPTQLKLLAEGAPHDIPKAS